MHAAVVLLVLILTYAGMAAGRIAWLRVDRTGIALLFAMMIISAQLAESGFIHLCARTITDSRRGTAALPALIRALPLLPQG